MSDTFAIAEHIAGYPVTVTDTFSVTDAVYARLYVHIRHGDIDPGYYPYRRCGL